MAVVRFASSPVIVDPAVDPAVDDSGDVELPSRRRWREWQRRSMWGMLNAPGTAEALADLIFEGRTRHVDLAPFRLSRLEALGPTRLATGA